MGIVDVYVNCHHVPLPLCHAENDLKMIVIPSCWVVVSKRVIRVRNGHESAAEHGFPGFSISHCEVIWSDMKSNISTKPPVSLGLISLKYHLIKQ
jgi:hypothetical protein